MRWTRPRSIRRRTAEGVGNKVMSMTWGILTLCAIALTLAVGAGLWIWTVRQLMRLRDAELEIRAAAIACSSQEFTGLRNRVARLEAIADGIH